MADPVSLLFVMGGARSGKSAFAQRQVEVRSGTDGLVPVFVATAEAYDAEMAERIAAHVATRGPHWLTLDAPYDLAEAIAAESGDGRILLVDCLTLWLSNRLLRGDDVVAASDALVAALGAAAGPIVLVSNEVGQGIVPDNALARRFRDVQGRLNQRIAAACGTVVLIVAGLPLILKGSRQTLAD